MALYDVFFSRRTGGDPTQVSEPPVGETIGNPGFRDRPQRSMYYTGKLICQMINVIEKSLRHICCSCHTYRQDKCHNIMLIGARVLDTKRIAVPVDIFLHTLSYWHTTSYIYVFNISYTNVKLSLIRLGNITNNDLTILNTIDTILVYLLFWYYYF